MMNQSMNTFLGLLLSLVSLLTPLAGIVISVTYMRISPRMIGMVIGFVGVVVIGLIGTLARSLFLMHHPINLRGFTTVNAILSLASLVFWLVALGSLAAVFQELQGRLRTLENRPPQF